jgi:hypothetical protein
MNALGMAWQSLGITEDDDCTGWRDGGVRAGLGGE